MNVRHFLLQPRSWPHSRLRPSEPQSVGRQHRQHPHGLASGGRAVRLARGRGRRERAVQEPGTPAGTSTSSTRAGLRTSGSSMQHSPGATRPTSSRWGTPRMTKAMAAGAFQDLRGTSFPNQSTWLAGLAKSGQYGGKVYGVPYYAGSRVITYRTDLFKSAGAADPHQHRGIHRRGQEARCEEQRGDCSRRSTSQARTGTSR